MTPTAHVIGDPIAQSKSPLIHGFWLDKLGIPGVYETRHVTPENLSDYLLEMRENPDWVGCNVTMPHKRAVMYEMYDVDHKAEAAGAVNTVLSQEDGTLLGTNTDIDGFLEPLREELKKQHYFRMARIIGTGGAARAIVWALAEEGFTLVLAGRNPDKAQAILDELAPDGEHHVIHLDHFAEPTDFAFDDREGCLDLVVNASPLGMTGDPSLKFDWSHAPPGSIAYDIVTSPADTPFLQAARAAGHETINGFAMLIGQAAFAFEKFFGVAPPREHDVELMEMLTQ
ncbi:shikimate dehydrogenase [uncultured Erythrobacter sp.]|uniref:shikimate dehydrogenase family protein n=1 Tax=uncultured Erythrobacter sp. TaxID=263913 RepID=UPI002635CD87|nr:shikimate dehydrogenase [uncultured Erythrobacter sp.]